MYLDSHVRACAVCVFIYACFLLQNPIIKSALDGKTCLSRLEIDVLFFVARYSLADTRENTVFLFEIVFYIYQSINLRLEK